MGNEIGQPEPGPVPAAAPVQGEGQGQALQIGEVGPEGHRPPIYRPAIRDFRPRRQVYTRIQKERAVRLLNLGVPCRHVATLMGPRCSSGTPVRWRKEARQNQAARLRMQQMLNGRR